jgi:hypothetical protein
MVYEFYEFWMQIKGKENLQTWHLLLGLFINTPISIFGAYNCATPSKLILTKACDCFLVILLLLIRVTLRLILSVLLHLTSHSCYHNIDTIGKGWPNKI